MLNTRVANLLDTGICPVCVAARRTSTLLGLVMLALLPQIVAISNCPILFCNSYKLKPLTVGTLLDAILPCRCALGGSR